NQMKKKYMRMNTQQLREATKAYDAENVNPRPVPVPPAEQALMKRFMRNAKAEARRSRGRPRLGKGARSVLITVDPKLLKRADTFAKRNRLSRSALFSRGIELAMSA